MKSKRKGLVVPDFLTASKGQLAYIDPTTNKRALTGEIINYGSGKIGDGWWGSEKMVEQVSYYSQPYSTLHWSESVVCIPRGPNLHSI